MRPNKKIYQKNRFMKICRMITDTFRYNFNVAVMVESIITT